jgi:HK97 gp10 family phage protein
MPDNEEFIRSMENATLKMVMDMSRKMDKACLVVESQAKQNCPVDIGILRASITSETEVTAREIVGRVGTNEEYGPYVHNGTGIYAKDGNGRKTPWGYTVRAGKHKGFHWTQGQRPQPFLENAKLEKKSAVERILGD